MALPELQGVWRCEIPGQQKDVRLPGTLDENGVGCPDDPAKQWKATELQAKGLSRPGDPILTRLTRRFTFEGEAVFTRQLRWTPEPGRRYFAECERARQLRLLVNGREAPACLPGTLSTPWIFEVTDLVRGEDTFAFLSDNSYPGWPRESIVYSSAATDETQTNWNGLLGRLRLTEEAPDFIRDVRVYPRGGRLDAAVTLDLRVPWNGSLRLRSDCLADMAAQECSLPAGIREVWFRDLPLRPDAHRWDLEDGFLYGLTAAGDGLTEKSVRFGLRDFRAADGRLTLNGRPFFLRGETNCAVFPETGHPPMDRDSWREILLRYRAYGVNCVRFHSHCPPEAAFDAADELGMLMQPELSHWNPTDAFAAPEARRYYRQELLAILQALANHPSFVMLTFGNELQADAAGHAAMTRLLDEARATDPTRLYAAGSNPHYGQLGHDPASDFYTAGNYRDKPMRGINAGPSGWLNEGYPDFRRNYDDAAATLRQTSAQPLFSFEVGQFESLPDFRQIDAYQGVTLPENLRRVREQADEAGMAADWPQRAEASGELALLCYRAEIEAALRTADFSGISLLGLQDFPGQGTALVGMMDAHLRPKPYDFARPERFRAFFRDALPLALLPRFTYTTGETLTAVLRMANYGKADRRRETRWQLQGAGTVISGCLPAVTAPAGALTELGLLTVPLPDLPEPAALRLTLDFDGERNVYPVWVYPDVPAACPDPVLECRGFGEEARAALARGGRVLLAPDSTEEALPNSIQAQFTTDFWSVRTFPEQSGGMGQLIDSGHPLFRFFPTEPHTDWQWWPMANQRAIILPEPVRTIVAELDSCAYLRPMAQLFECRCGGGRLLVSSLGLHRLPEYPEVRALRRAIYAYMVSEDFRPEQELTPDWIEALFRRKE